LAVEAQLGSSIAVSENDHFRRKADLPALFGANPVHACLTLF